MPFSARQGFFSQPAGDGLPDWQSLTRAQILAETSTWTSTGSPSVSTVVANPLGPYGNAHFRPMVAHPNGKIYIAPCLTPLSDRILEFDPETNTITEITMPGVNLTGSVKYNNGVLGADNKIYYCPVDAPEFLIVDPVNEVYTTTDFGFTFSGSAKFSAMVTWNNKIYAMGGGTGQPYVLIIDTDTGTATQETFGNDSAIILTTVNKFTSGAVSLKDDYIYFGPYDIVSSDRKVLKIDPTTNTLTKLGNADIFTNQHTQGVGNDLDGNIILAGHNFGSHFIKLDVDTETFIDSGIAQKCVGTKLGVDGNTYSPVFFGSGDGLAVVEQGDIANVSTNVLSASITNASWGTCLHPNGKQYWFPNNSGNPMYEITTPGTGENSSLLDRIPFTQYFNYVN